MTTHKLLAFAGLALVMFPLRHAEFWSRTANDCKCDLNDLGCKIVCSGIGSGKGTGGGASTYDVAPRKDNPPQERPIIVPEPDNKSTTGK
jgi:hypothetical protein